MDVCARSHGVCVSVCLYHLFIKVIVRDWSLSWKKLIRYSSYSLHHTFWVTITIAPSVHSSVSNSPHSSFSHCLSNLTYSLSLSGCLPLYSPSNTASPYHPSFPLFMFHFIYLLRFSFFSFHTILAFVSLHCEKSKQGKMWGDDVNILQLFWGTDVVAVVWQSVVPYSFRLLYLYL